MNWDAVGALAELAGAAGVIVSLLYLAHQIRASSAATRSAAAETAGRAFREVLIPVYADPQLTEIYARVWVDFESLEGTDRRQALMLMWVAFKAAEEIHYHHARGVLDEDAWSGWENIFSEYMNTPGFQAWWALRGHTFSRTFRQWVEETATHTGGTTLGAV